MSMHDFWNMFILCIESGLTVTQTKRVLWKVYCEKTLREIAVLDETSYQTIDDSLRASYKKLRKNMSTLTKR